MNQLILHTLSQVGAPVSFQTHTGPETTYITFFEYNQYPTLSMDDDDEQIAHSIQVDVWSKGNYLTLVRNVKKAMRQAGFKWMFETEIYEEETKDYHKVLRFSYFKENEEE